MKTLVTHNGICHADEILATVILGSMYDVDYKNVIRTRDNKVLSEYKDNPDVFIYDVGQGEYDHHYKDAYKIGNRTLSSVGLVWHKMKDNIMLFFGLDETSWHNIDITLIEPIDRSDNGGNLNPFNYALNAYINSLGLKPIEFESLSQKQDWLFVQACLFCDMLFTNIINMEVKATKERDAFSKLPTETINGKIMKIADRIYTIGRTFSGVDGVITDSNGSFKILMLNGGSVSKCGIQDGEIEGVKFTHVAGFCAECYTMDAVKLIL